MCVDGEDSLYLYHPLVFESVSSQGEQIGSIGNYNTDGYKFNLPMAFKQTLYVLLTEPLSNKKFFIFVTDRIQDAEAIKKAINLDYKEMIDCHFFIIGIGDFYNRESLSVFAESSNISLVHLDDPTDLNFNIFKENSHGQELRSTTGECCQSVQFSSGHNCAVSRPIRFGDATDKQYFSENENELLPIDSSGRLQSESGIYNKNTNEFSEKCGEIETGECGENNSP